MFERVFTRRSVHAFALAAAALLALGTRTDSAFADAQVNAVVMVLLATHGDGGGSIDPSIGDLPQLKRPPFSAYNTYKLLERKSLPLEKGKPATLALVNGRTLQVTMTEVTADKRYQVATAINQPGGQAFLKLLEVKAAANEPFFVAGQSYQGGTMVLGITIKP